MFLRILRVLKVTKLLRLVRAVRFLRDLRIFAECLRGCLMQLFWALVMICLVLLIFALFFVQAMSGFLSTAGEGPYEDGVQKADIVAYYGSVQKAMLTLLE